MDKQNNNKLIENNNGWVLINKNSTNKNSTNKKNSLLQRAKKWYVSKSQKLKHMFKARSYKKINDAPIIQNTRAMQSGIEPNYQNTTKINNKKAIYNIVMLHKYGAKPTNNNVYTTLGYNPNTGSFAKISNDIIKELSKTKSNKKIAYKIEILTNIKNIANKFENENEINQLDTDINNYYNTVKEEYKNITDQTQISKKKEDIEKYNINTNNKILKLTNALINKLPRSLKNAYNRQQQTMDTNYLYYKPYFDLIQRLDALRELNRTKHIHVNNILYAKQDHTLLKPDPRNTGLYYYEQRMPEHSKNITVINANHKIKKTLKQRFTKFFSRKTNNNN